MDAVISAPASARPRGARGRLVGIAGAVAAVLVTSLVGAVPAHAAEQITPPDGLAITGDLHVGETVKISAEGWTPADVMLSFDWFIDGVSVDDPAEAQTPLDLHLRPEWVGSSVSAIVTAESADASPLTVELTADGPVALGEWALSAPALVGPAQVGETLAVSVPGVPDGVTLGYRWLLDNAVIPDATAPTYTPAVAQIGHQLAVVVTGARDGYVTRTARSAPALVGEGIFTTTEPTIAGAVRVDSTLTAVPGTSPSSAELAYSWKVGTAEVSTGSSYTPVAADKGKPLTLAVAVSQPGYATDTQTTDPVLVGAGVFTSAPSPTISSAVRVDSTLTAVDGTWGPTASIAHAWKLDGKVVSTAKTFTPTAAQLGKKLTLSVTATRAGFTTLTRSTTAVAVGAGVFSSAPTPLVKGTLRVGSTLTASVGAWSPTATLRYQWLRDGSAISGANASTYKLTTADGGRKITLRVTGSRTAYTTTSKWSAATSAIVKVFTGVTAPVISGTVRVGSTLTAKIAAWNPTATISYQWKRSGASIAGATSSAYRLTASDYGNAITVTVTGKRAGYSSRAVTSAATAGVQGPAAALTQPGMYRVGTQVKPGTYYANAKAGCYWERRSTAGDDFDGIIANDFRGSAGRDIVTISASDKYFTFDAECGPWTPFFGLGTPASSFGNGTQAVGVHIRPGRYTTTSALEGCYWERMAGFSGTLDDINDNYFSWDAPGRLYVQIYASDRGFYSDDCGTWTRVGN